MIDSQENKKNKMLEDWVNQYADQIFSWAFHKTLSKETAEDLVQETFLAATKSFDQCQNKNKPKSWLFSILNNKIIDHYRKITKSIEDPQSKLEKNRTSHIENMYNPHGNWTNDAREIFATTEEHLLDNPDFNKLLKRCLEGLPSKWKTAVLSKFILEKNGNEICQELNITPSNYWQVIRRAKLALKVCIEKHWK